MRKFKRFYSSYIIFALTIVCYIQATNLKAQTIYKSVEEAKGLSVGAKVKNFTTSDQNDSLFKLYKNLEKGPVVLLFYRGQWCPVCNKHLSRLEDNLQLIYDKGAKVIAVSPEKSEFLKMTAEKTSTSLTLLFDKEYKISEAFDVVYQPDEKMRHGYNTRLNANLKKVHSDDSQRLPVPATFIIDQHGKIVWRHFNHDYKKRASAKQILEALDTMEKKHH